MVLATLGSIGPEAAETLPSFSVGRGKSKDMWIESDHKWINAPVLYARHFVIIAGRTLKETFAGFLRFLLVWLGHNWMLEVRDEILRAAARRS